MRTRLAIILAAALGVVASLALAGAPAQAATGSTATVADRLVLEPTERGYRGSLEVDLTYHGAEPTFARYVVTEPIVGSYLNDAWATSCYSSGHQLPDGRIRVECEVPGGRLMPGEHRRFRVDFQVLTAVQAYAMKAGNGRLAVTVDGQTVTDETFRTRFRSTTGSLADPQPYVQDTQVDLSVSVAGPLTLVRHPAGGFAGTVRVTVSAHTDAPHRGVRISGHNLSADFGWPWTEECSHECVPGGPIAEGEERTFDLHLDYFGTTVGDLGEISLEVQAEWLTPQTDANPADNVATFRAFAVDAA
ncbi:hypothetical protein ACQP26_28425 [Micromonospora sp. CA-248089]|uniref:hypothetical protein n=1 Tax=Micromonospora sp. CA-248089 TaxID=3239960 RepID=UPI003D902A70